MKIGFFGKMMNRVEDEGQFISGQKWGGPKYWILGDASIYGRRLGQDPISSDGDGSLNRETSCRY